MKTIIIVDEQYPDLVYISEAPGKYAVYRQITVAQNATTSIRSIQPALWPIVHD